MGHIHQSFKRHKTKIKPRSPLHKVLANAKLQVKNKTFKVEPGPQDVSFNEHPICIRAKDL
jgi:hypothetical protein